MADDDTPPAGSTGDATGDATETLFAAALAVRAHAHVPYSRFPVGAALRTRAGHVFVGANVENAAYPEGICAEASAIAAMVAAGEREIDQLVT
ncbi:MAG: cytidine deaminase, partial [Ilumatobacter sp.]|nr:cytidine deaminase [Ilumatobacter sp.]